MAAQKMLLKRPTNIRKWIARFITLGIYTPLEARVYCSHVGDFCHRYGHTSALLVYTSGFLPVVFALISLSEGEIIPFSGVCQSGGCIIHAGGVVASRTD